MVFGVVAARRMVLDDELRRILTTSARWPPSWFGTAARGAFAAIFAQRHAGEVPVRER